MFLFDRRRRRLRQIDATEIAGRMASSARTRTGGRAETLAALRSARRSAAFCWIGTICISIAAAKCCYTWAARTQMVEEVIRPALAQGKTVLCDRYLWPTSLTRAMAARLDVATLWEVGRIATGGLAPDLTVVLDVPPEVAAARMARPLDRMELQGAAFHARVRPRLSYGGRPDRRTTSSSSTPPARLNKCSWQFKRP